ncbi:hypothetical protein LIER_11821 [Lithospermum erythrorhizon]|uniref:Uncharacterized protein n=1 Tax=Lithospermum erythrorhizon TaxID=34254 RepID=A0AAV3PUK7_LITER
MSRLRLLDWKRRKLRDVQLSIQSNQAELDTLQQDCDQLLTMRLERDAVEVLDKDFGEEEIKQCLFSMAGNKAPGPDGTPATFLKHY